MGAGLGLTATRAMRRMRSRGVVAEGALTRADYPWLAGAILSGGVFGPVLLMIGLSKSAAANASLLLNSEAVLTAVLAWTIFRENYDRRIMLGMAVIVGGAIILSWGGRPATSNGVGELLIAAACLCWAIDNNLTRMVSGGDPQLIAALKGLVAGAINVAIGFMNGAYLPSFPTLVGAGLVGWIGYGLSLQFYVLALRHIGTARTGAYFSVAPFAGAVLSLLMFDTQISVALVVAALLMGVGVWLHLSERHEHEHTHDAILHDHRHIHDVHHLHEHEPKHPTSEPHSHPHQHVTLTHKHPHYPDLHHRHVH